LETILDLGRKHDLPLPAWDVDNLRRFVQVIDTQPGVMAFIEKFEWAIGILVDYDACWRIACESVEDAFKEGIDYIELRFSPWFMAEPHGLDPYGVVEATTDGVIKAGRETGLKVNLIGILSRTYGPEQAWKELDALLSQKDKLVGIDLAGDEANFPGEIFVEHIQRARQAGLKVTVHAGESAGPESVWQALSGLNADRLGHAVRAVEDEILLDYLVENRIGIESNLTSNVQTSTVSEYAVHPLRVYLERGLLATINTDDPRISGIDLRYEYQVAAPAAGLSQKQIVTAQSNALKVAFLCEPERNSLLVKRSQS
jgi:adenosine deaminase